jgi:O-antigen/teichoic acid export membrane protein
MSLKQTLILNTAWSIGGQIGNSIILLVANIIYARSLSPADFGQLGIVMFFIVVSNVLIEGGLGGALIRKNDATEKDFSTAFLFNFFVSLFLYSLLLMNAGGIARFYHDPQLKKILMVIGCILVINSFVFIQNTRLVKDIQFRKITLYNLASNTFANAVGLVLVFSNFGIWSLVAARILTPLCLLVILWTREGPIGRITFDKDSFRYLFGFGMNTSAASIIDTVFNNIYQLILGKYFSISEAGYYYQAKRLQDFPNTIIYGSANSVIFSSLAKVQDDRRQFISIYLRIVSFLSMAMGLITSLIIIFSKEIVTLLFGPKWIASSVFLVYLALASFFYVHEMLNRVIFKVYDKTPVILRLELVKKLILSISIIIGIALSSIKALLIGFFVVSVISYAINYVFSRKIMSSISWAEIISLFKVILAIAVCSAFTISARHFLALEGNKPLLLVPLTIAIYWLCLRFQGIRLSLAQVKNA